ncbi:2-dehydropantoate 2-reductase [Candidatus Woesearchaeota archaeon]|nr:2-dehydropantoate 2-reductase [Candidatus Woesearchaeota archaeon]
MIVVLGAGAIGRFFGEKLKQVGEVVSFIGRKDPIDTQQTDFVLVATKAYDTEEAIKRCKDLISDDTVVISLQNGLGNEEIISQYAQHVIGGVTSTGVMLVDGEVELKGIGETVIGDFKGTGAEKFLALLKKTDLPVRLSEDIGKDIYHKFLINVGLNALGAVAGAENGKMAENEYLRNIAQHLISEGITIGKAEGFTFENVFEGLMDVCKKTSGNRNSMYQDVLNGKKTEIDFLNGKIVELGKKHQINVPYNEAISSLVRARAGLNSWSKAL